MSKVHWPLEVLSRSIAYRNLTGASQHIGMSQPQLSRLISRLEEELNLTLLDRSSKRNSAWTLEARKLVEVYNESQRKMHLAIAELQHDHEPKGLHLGTLEGLIPLAVTLSERIYQKTSVNFIQLDVLDLDELEAAFLSKDLDLIFSARVPGRAKPKFTREVGWQGFETFSEDARFGVFSPFEYNQLKNKSHRADRVLVSNSLAVRRHWLNTVGGSGQIPGHIESRKRSGHVAVVAVGQDHLHPKLWEQLI